MTSTAPAEVLALLELPLFDLLDRARKVHVDELHAVKIRLAQIDFTEVLTPDSAGEVGLA